MRFKIDEAGLQWEGNLPFLLCFALYSRANSRRGDLTEGFLRFDFGGGYISRGLYMEGLILGILLYVVQTGEGGRGFSAQEKGKIWPRLCS